MLGNLMRKVSRELKLTNVNHRLVNTLKSSVVKLYFKDFLLADAQKT